MQYFNELILLFSFSFQNGLNDVDDFAKYLTPDLIDQQNKKIKSSNKEIPKLKCVQAKTEIYDICNDSLLGLVNHIPEKGGEEKREKR